VNVVRLHELQKRKGKDLAWYLLGFFVVQLGLAVGIDAYWTAIRDPEFAELLDIVRKRQVEAPGRPLVLVLGSSRTRGALRAEYLNCPGDETRPLVINCGVNASFAMLQQVHLRRFLEAGIRPRLVFVEVMPRALSARGGAALEEKRFWGARLSAPEAARVWNYFGEPYRLVMRWGPGRLLPVATHRVELRDALALDVPTSGWAGYAGGRDSYGWCSGPSKSNQQEYERLTRECLNEYLPAITQPALSPGAQQAIRDLVNLGRQEHIAVVLFIPSEASVFNSYGPEVAEGQLRALHTLAHELGVPLIDTSDWIDEGGFWDGHHATPEGANQYTSRFAREALALGWPRLGNYRQVNRASSESP
jgi:hypothetical protein